VFEVFTTVIMKGAVFWVVTPCRSKTQRFGNISLPSLMPRNKPKKTSKQTGKNSMEGLFKGLLNYVKY
jgi:hypothetical protein